MPEAPREAQGEPLELSRARQIFRFLKAFAERRVPTPRTLSQQPWTLRLRELPEHPSVSVGEVHLTDDQGESDAREGAAPLLRVARPKLTPAPRPPLTLAPYLKPGWEDCTGEVNVLQARNVVRNGETVTERFADDPERVSALTAWQTRWTVWAEAERPAVAAMRLFERLYELRGAIERESEQVELVLGDGRLQWRREQALVDHPVLLQRVELHFDSHAPAFEVVDAERGPELYASLVAEESALSSAELSRLRGELERGGFHPLAKDGTSGYLRRLVQLLSPRGRFSDRPEETPIGPDPRIARDAFLFLRRRPSGFAAAFDRVLEDIETRRSLPASLTRLVGIEPSLPELPTTNESSPWGEPADVLLSKPANTEQVQIARALERHRAVLVQGPPGTGKTHTIANLIGHLVAQGKRVLVTSHTAKALRVVRDQVVQTLQPLCVSVLDSDADSRAQLEGSVRGILSRLTVSSSEDLQREIAALTALREALNNEIAAITDDLRTIREAEYRPIVIAGESVEPADAARQVRDLGAGNDWIPGPLEAGSPLPLSAAELLELYASNTELTPAEDAEITGILPDLAQVPKPETFAAWVRALSAAEPGELAAFWEAAASEDSIPALARLARLILAAADELARMEPWQRAVVSAGHGSGPGHDLWTTLGTQIESAFAAWQASRELLLDHTVEIAPALNAAEVLTIAEEIRVHLSNGGAIGKWARLTRPAWKRVLAGCLVEGREPSTATDFRAISAQVALDESRRRLRTRWARQAEPIGLPAFEALGSAPEPVLREYAAQFEELLAWWNQHWTVIEEAMRGAGFRWKAFRAREVARSSPASPFERDAEIVCGTLRDAVSLRLEMARRVAALRLIEELHELLDSCDGAVARELKEAVRSRRPQRYASSRDRLVALARKEQLWRRRRELLARLSQVAPQWALAIHNREAGHGKGAPPGEPEPAWRWRQLCQEVDRRAQLDEIALSARLHERQKALRQTTAELIDRRAWLEQIGRTDLNAQQALQGWADTQRRIGRGTGRRVPALQARARKLLADAREAVPVWIMPLARVAESFDPRQRKFDVVILDESSQADVTGLLAWYLGQSVAVVGDHEQVSPLAVGQNLDAITALINQHLEGIRNSHLFDGRTSVYDLARQCFGGTIALREHFRCVPDIIGFSDELAYNFEIRPLRAPHSAPTPHVAEFVVDRTLGTGRSSETNLAEARSVVALLKAATEQPEYASRTFGAITLLGDAQAGMIQDLAVRLVGAIELDQRRFLAGNAAQFQGDERDVVFLSMVDSVDDAQPLSLRQDEPTKQRYNVAASRAKDQLWLVHSLNPGVHLKEGDLRRRLIEYVRHPGAARRAREEVTRRAESPFERAVAERLVAAGYRVRPQVTIGKYRIDLVVSSGSREVAVECDGDRFHDLSRIPDDMARQAVLERAGWRFIRIRGTRFFRDPESTMGWVFEELEKLGVGPGGFGGAASSAESPISDLRDRVVRRAYEIMRELDWITAASVAPEN